MKWLQNGKTFLVFFFSPSYGHFFILFGYEIRFRDETVRVSAFEDFAISRF